MSLETWEEEFYPVPASEVPESEAVQHSLRKWIGLRQENLDKHGLQVWSGYISDGFGGLDIDMNSCSLCVHFYINRQCSACPLANYLGHPCDQGGGDPYAVFIDYNNPEPMIQALSEIDE